MRRSKHQIRATTKDAALWKDKYLQSLDDQETMQKKWSRRAKLLRQGLISLGGMAAETDQQLNKHLTELDLILKRDDMQGLGGVINDIERDARRVESRDKHNADLISILLAKIAEQLEPLAPNRKVEKQLNKVRSRLKADDADQHLLVLTKKLVLLLGEICAEIGAEKGAQEKPKGFWRTLLSSKDSSDNKDENGPGDEAAGSGETDDHADSDLVVPEEVNSVLFNLLNQFSLEESEESKREKIAERIQGEIKQADLTPVLKDVAEMVIAAVCRNQHDFQGFLEELVNRLFELQEILNSVRNGQDHRTKKRRSLNESMSRHLSKLGSLVRDADDLNVLKNTVQMQLDELTVIVDQFHTEEEEEQKSLGVQLQELADSVVHMESEVVQSKRDLEEQRQRALTDPLTKLPNREAYQERLQLEEDHWLKNGGHLALAVGDIDLFKKVNDRYGHAAGDKVLRVIGHEISANLRDSDFVARYGGEEFVLLLPGTSAEEAANVLDKIRQELQQCPFKFKGNPIQVTMSFGISEFKGGDQSDKVFRRADAALYQAKENGRNRCQQYISH